MAFLVQPTQALAAGLINSVLYQDLNGVEERISDNIELTYMVQGKPVVKHGKEEYLEVIRGMWQKAEGCYLSIYAYSNFSACSGQVQYTHLCKVNLGQGPRYMLASGVQVFSFENRKVTSINVNESDEILSDEAAQEILKTNTLSLKILSQPKVSSEAVPSSSAQTQVNQASTSSSSESWFHRLVLRLLE